MRQWKAEAFRQCDEPKKPEIINADSIAVVGNYVEFHVKDDSQEYGYRTIAVRQNCNVSEITEGEK